ncbi:MAG TPA: LCP family protein [Acidimicrobiales bacterium]
MRRPHRTWPQRLLLTLNVALVLVCLVAAGGIWWTYNQASALPRIDVGASLSPQTEAGEAQNILLVGIDDGTDLDDDDPVKRGRGATLNTDTVMILRIEPQTQKAALLSLPRDLYVDLAGGGKGRINTALALGGPQRLIETIKQDFGIPINHYAMVDFHGFESLVAAVDGVPVYFNHPSRDEATGLFQYDPGCVNLDPEQALAYARSRHFEIRREGSSRWVEDPTSDIGRITRQQEFIKAALRKAVAKGVRNPFVLRDLIGVAQENVTLDTEFSIQDLVDLGLQFKDFDPDDLATYAPSTRGTMVGAMSVLLLNNAESEPIFDVFRGIAPIPGRDEPVPLVEDPSTTTSAPGSPTTTAPSRTTVAPTTTTTINEFIPRVPEGETCG